MDSSPLGHQGSPLALDFDLRSDSTLQGSGFSLQIKLEGLWIQPMNKARLRRTRLLCQLWVSRAAHCVFGSVCLFDNQMQRERCWRGGECETRISNTNAPERLLIARPMAVNLAPRCLRAWHTPFRPDAPHPARLPVLSTQCEHHGLRRALPAVRPSEDALPAVSSHLYFSSRFFVVFQAAPW